MDIVTLAQLEMVILALAIVIVLLVSIKFTKQTVDKTNKNTQAQIVMTLLDDYASQEMRQAQKELRQRKTKYNTNYMAEFQKLRDDDSNKWDHSRRFVAHYFQKIAAMLHAGLLDKDVARIAATEQQVDFYREVIEPLEIVVNPDYEPATFNILEALWK